jgi:PAT family beta-lactamase induction signal transducer AmpG
MSGIVFMGVSANFPFMLSEMGVKISQISLVFIASLPYGLKFLLAPFIKNIINKYSSSKIDILKTMSFISQGIILLLFISIGFFEIYRSMSLAFVLVFLITTVISISDILCFHIKLISFGKSELGIAAAFSNMGFRLGSFISGAAILYIANAYSWHIGFLTVSFSILLSTIATIVLPKITNTSSADIDNKSFFVYVKYLIGLLKKRSFWIVLTIFFSFKFSDICINSLKPIFLQLKGISKTDFANVSQIPGIIAQILGGLVAGFGTYKMKIESCIKASIIGGIIASLLFLYVAISNLNLVFLAIIMTISTFIFAISTIVLRTYIAQISNSNVVVYTLLLSMGSIVRVLSSYTGALIVENYSWIFLYITCLVSNFPIFFIYKKLFSPKVKFLL